MPDWVIERVEWMRIIKNNPSVYYIYSSAVLEGKNHGLVTFSHNYLCIKKLGKIPSLPMTFWVLILLNYLFFPIFISDYFQAECPPGWLLHIEYCYIVGA